MSEKDNQTSPRDKLPSKLRERLEAADSEDDGEIIIGDGEIELSSETPVLVVEYFLRAHELEWSDGTHDDYSYTLTRLLEYLDYAGIDTLSEIDGSTMEGFKSWRKRDAHVELSTLEGQLKNIRVCVRWCERIGIVDDGVADDIVLPELDPSDVVSYRRIDTDTADAIITYHQNREYVTRAYTEWVLMWELLLRTSDIRAIDLEHYHPEEGYIELVSNPEEDTRLKNGANEVEGEGSEREVNVPDWVCDILDTYINGTGDPNHPKRIDTTDDYGRNPLFTTRKGRVSDETVRRDIYRITQPCRHGQECPHDRDPDTCEARNDNNILSRCPSNVSPHPVRRGGICHQLTEGVPKETICGKADVSLPVLNKHYDLRAKEEARIQRRTVLSTHMDGYDDPVAPDEPATLQESPELSDISDVTKEYVASAETIPSPNRAVKGTVAYAVFVALTALNIGLLGNPLA
jgi:site-specific recombinase XerC